MEPKRKPFFGRDRILFEISHGVLAPQPQSFSIVGPKFIGKSQLLRHLAAEQGPLLGDDYAEMRPHSFRDGRRVIVTWVDCDWRDAQLDLPGWVYANLWEHVRERARIDLDWTRVEAETLPARRIWQLARLLNDQGFRLILLMDNFDRVFENELLSVDTVDELRPLTLELSLLVATEQPLHDLDRDLAASPLFNVMTQLFLGLLEPAAASTWILAYGDEFPDIAALSEELLVLTGMHPFLLRRLGDILTEVGQMIPGIPIPDSSHLPLLRLRLAEHGRLLFQTAWKRLQAPPLRVQPETVNQLLNHLVIGELPLASVKLEQAAALNWLINQAIVTCCMTPEQNSYQLFTPLFAEFLARRLGSESRAVQASMEPATSQSMLPPELLDQFTKTEAALLRYFQSHQNETISSEQLLIDVWKRPEATNRRVQEAIRRLRLQLEAYRPAIGRIENDRGRGYRFVPAR